MFGYAGVPCLDPCPFPPSGCGVFLKINLTDLSINQMLKGLQSFSLGQATTDTSFSFGYISTDKTIFIIRLDTLTIVHTINVLDYIRYVPPYFTWHSSVVSDVINELAYFYYAFSSVNSTFVFCISFKTHQIQAFSILNSPYVCLSFSFSLSLFLSLLSLLSLNSTTHFTVHPTIKK
jgi:hypothetical protein